MRNENRLKKNKEFQIVFKNGKSYANRQFVLYFLKKDNQDKYRVGLSVSKKIGNAVTRNQVKRYVKQVFIELNDELLQNMDYVIIARKPTSEMDFHEVKKSLEHLFFKAKVRRNVKVKE